MFNRCLFMLIFLIVLPTAAFAHTGLKNSTPSKGETIQQAVNEIVLNFESAVQPSAGIEVTNNKGEKMPISITVKGKMVKGSFTSSLLGGTYEVKWNITADDGDNIKDTYSFTVKLPPPPVTKQPEQSVQVTVVPSPSTPVETVTPLPHPNTESKTDTSPNTGVSTNVLVIIAILIIIVILGLLFVLRKRGR